MSLPRDQALTLGHIVADALRYYYINGFRVVQILPLFNCQYSDATGYGQELLAGGKESVTAHPLLPSLFDRTFTHVPNFFYTMPPC